MASKKAISQDSIGGIFLFVAALLALILSNSPLEWLYDLILHTHVMVMVGEYGLDKSLLHWINDGLMAVFFFHVGLEVKKEILRGELSDIRRASLPVIAALGGVITPALIYVLFNFNDPKALDGWAIPMATDIAFALGVLSIVGSRIPKQLKILLLSLAIIDDLLAIMVIALFYTSKVSLVALCLSGIALMVIVAFNQVGIKRTGPYILVGIVMWACVLESGVHATLAGVFLAMCIPMDADRRKGESDEAFEERSPLLHLEHALKPWVAFFIMPVFAFANAGVSVSGFSFGTVASSIPMGIILGLFLGKQLGVFSFIWVAVKTGLCQKPAFVSWGQIYGLAVLTGIGFTMSFFIGGLAFDDDLRTMQVRVGVLVASTLSALAGYVVLNAVCKPSKRKVSTSS